MNDQSVGVLYKLTTGWPLIGQLKIAKANFNNAPHAGLAGHLPVHARLHPYDVPAGIIECDGLLILADDTVRPGYVRITTASFTDEFAAERRYLVRRLETEQAACRE